MCQPWNSSVCPPRALSELRYLHSGNNFSLEEERGRNEGAWSLSRTMDPVLGKERTDRGWEEVKVKSPGQQLALLETGKPQKRGLRMHAAYGLGVVGQV